MKSYIIEWKSNGESKLGSFGSILIKAESSREALDIFRENHPCCEIDYFAVA